ncbi:MAG TPA: TonB-dependent receptor [Vicinamibacterales bacterium]|jgi:outer membrane cobalamin receptor|nr:TonB-dependent receptor [Vicinamibacterales bacterium]
MLVRLRFPAFVFLSLLLAVVASYAQTPDTGGVVLDPSGTPTIRESIVVTPTGNEEIASKVGASITVIAKDQIDERHALDTVDLLRTVPGVMAVRTGGIGNLTSLFVRGGESSYNKVLLDGMPLNEPGGFFNFASLAPENIDHIEVLRGAHSALFGSDAMASVIQIFSARPAPNGGRPQANITVDAGTYNTAHVAGGIGGINGPAEYSVFGSRLSSDNRVPNNKDRATVVSGALRLGQQPDGALKLLGRGDFGRTGVPGPAAYGRPDLDAFFTHKDGDILAGWDRSLGSHVLQRASYSFTVTHQRSTNLVTDPPYTPRLGNLVAPFPASDFLYDSGTNLRRHHVDYRADVSISPGQTITAAFAYDGERGVLTDYRSTAAPQRPARHNTGTTVQYEAITGPVSVVGGVRFENNGSFGFYAAPRATVSWLVRRGNDAAGATRLRGSAGLGIKEPTFLQSYSPDPGFQGNPNLKPERSRGFDAGLEQRLAHDRVRVEATYFANHFDDLISLGPFDPVTFASQYFNIGETRASGLELAADAAVRRGLQVRGNYTLLDSRVIRSTSSSPIFAPGKPLYRRPRNSGSMQAAFTRDRLSLTLGAIFVGSRVDTDFYFPSITSDKAYATWNAGGDVRLTRGTSGFVVIENLANRDYMDPIGYPALGRTVRAGVRARF